MLSNFGCRQIPSPSTLSQTVADIARFVFLSTPMSALCTIHSGIPSSHKAFWCSKSPSDLHCLYQALTATPAKVLNFLEEPYCVNKARKMVFGYLRQYTGSMTLDQLRLFLRFATGSSVFTASKLEVQFNMLFGLARRPIAHTCSNLLELSATYVSYPEFVKEFNLVLSDETYTWIMDAL